MAPGPFAQFLLFSFDQRRCDFEQLREAAFRDQRPHAGILIASLRSSDLELARQIMTMLDTYTAEEVVNQLFSI